MLHYSHVIWTSYSRDFMGFIHAFQYLRWVMKQTWCHSTTTLKDIQRSNNEMHVSQINACRYLFLHIFHSAWTGTLNQTLFNASCRIMHFYCLMSTVLTLSRALHLYASWWYTTPNAAPTSSRSPQWVVYCSSWTLAAARQT